MFTRPVRGWASRSVSPSVHPEGEDGPRSVGGPVGPVRRLPDVHNFQTDVADASPAPVPRRLIFDLTVQHGVGVESRGRRTATRSATRKPRLADGPHMYVRPVIHDTSQRLL